MLGRLPIPALGQHYTSVCSHKRKHQFWLFAKLALIHHRHPTAVLLTHDEMQTGLEIIDQYLNLKTPLDAQPEEGGIKEVVDDEMVEKAQDIYEQYFFRFGKLDLARV